MLNKSYIAGLFDGEGSISIRPQSKKRYLSSVNISVGIGMCNPIVKKLYKKFGGYVYIIPAQDNHRKIYKWYLINKKDIHKFLTFIYSNLIIKKEQAKIMLKFIRLKTVSGRKRNSYLIKRAFKYINKIRKLNGRVKRKDINFRYCDV